MKFQQDTSSTGLFSHCGLCGEALMTVAVKSFFNWGTLVESRDPSGSKVCKNAEVAGDIHQTTFRRRS